MKVIVVTGGIGSGKSAICRFLESRGIPVYDSDSRCKALYDRFPALKEMIVPDMFRHPERLRTLEEAVYPLLKDDFGAWVLEQGAEFVAFESAVVLQKEEFRDFGDYVLLVDAAPGLRLERAMLRGGEKGDMIRRMALQRDERSNPRVDFVIENDGSLHDAEAQTDKFLKTINYYGNREN